ncbi:hypothetical protein LPJ61_004174 [Coemansia biformis]|uniref:Band 7 domain-containing protein n=1 Tax=Coemansia biformis TaxID=1286918 RepID=A0A9W7YAR9_9FUNG|nr:hypothetical protein LPJ61_004174 [Coemansia biformis]
MDTIQAVSSQASGVGYAPPAAPAYETRKFADELPVATSNAYDRLMNLFGNCLGAIGQFPCCFCFPNPYKEVNQGEIAMVSRFGRYYKTADPGLVRVNPLTERVLHVDTKIQITPITNLTIVTKDNVSVGIEAVLYWHVNDPYLATFGVSNVKQALIERTQTTLRAVLGGRDLQDLIENRGTIASAIAGIIDKPAQVWGVSIESILIKDIGLSRELQDSLSSAATQKRIGQSKVIQAQAEVDAAILMREAAEILNTPAAMQIRTLDSMVMMAKAANTKVLFVPVNQDYSTGSINAFGGAGSTLGINAALPGHHPVATSVDPDTQTAMGNSLSLPVPRPRELTQSHTNPIAQPVKDSAVFTQLAEM